MTQEIEISDTPHSKKGFLRRQKRYLAIMKRINLNDSTAIDDLVAYIMTEMVVHAPEGANLADFILDLSQDEYDAIFRNSVSPTNGA